MDCRRSVGPRADPFGKSDLVICWTAVGLGGPRKPNNRGYFNSPATVWGEILKGLNLWLKKPHGPWLSKPF